MSDTPDPPPAVRGRLLCPSCHGDAFDPVPRTRHWYRCLGCGLQAFNDDTPDALHWHAAAYAARGRLSRLAEVGGSPPRPGVWLEFDPPNAGGLCHLRRGGWSVRAVVSRPDRSAALAAGTGLPVMTLDHWLALASAAPASADRLAVDVACLPAAFLADTPDPAAVVRSVAQSVRPGGVLLAEGWAVNRDAVVGRWWFDADGLVRLLSGHANGGQLGTPAVGAGGALSVVWRPASA